MAVSQYDDALARVVSNGLFGCTRKSAARYKVERLPLATRAIFWSGLTSTTMSRWRRSPQPWLSASPLKASTVAHSLNIHASRENSLILL